MQVFVETHTYDGGFKSGLIPFGNRPALLPNADQVGLQSNEVQLAAGDFAIELTFFRRGSHFIYWLGCYTRGIDLIHGDRGTYCGVGLWLIDADLKHVSHLIAFIEGATRKLAETNRATPEIVDKLSAFVSEFSELGWCVPKQPGPVAERRAVVTSRDMNSSYLILPDNEKTSFDLAGIDILGEFLIRPTYDYSRRVYFLAKQSQIFVQRTQQVSFKNALTYAEHMIYSVGAVATRSLNREPPLIGAAQKISF